MILDSIIKGIVFIYLKLVYWFKIEGMDNIPKVGSGIICPNHISNCDGPVIVSSIHRKVWTMTKKEAFIPIIGGIIRRMGCYPIDRSKKDLTALKKSLQLLKDNQLVCVFPEGTRHGFEKGVKLHKGVAFLATSAKVPIIPVGINGKFGIFSRPIIKIGKPVYLDEYYEDKDIKDKYDEINEKIVLNMKMQLTNNKKN